MNQIVRLLQEWAKQKATGKITINFFKGGISSYKVEETFKPLKAVKSDDKKNVGEYKYSLTSKRIKL